MKRLIAAVMVWVAAASAANAQDCAYDRAAMLALSFHAFDQDLTPGGWRAVDGVGCEATAADLIAEYRTYNAAYLVNGEPQQITGLNWHEAQLRASAGQTERAIALFRKTYPRATESDTFYADATIAFLEKDREALQTARDALAALPEPPWFADAIADLENRTGQQFRWPLNLDVVDGFLACFDRSYREAYGADCRPAAP